MAWWAAFALEAASLGVWLHVALLLSEQGATGQSVSVAFANVTLCGAVLCARALETVRADAAHGALLLAFGSACAGLASIAAIMRRDVAGWALVLAVLCAGRASAVARQPLLCGGAA